MEEKNKICIVTGGSGLLGKAIQEVLIEELNLFPNISSEFKNGKIVEYGIFSITVDEVVYLFLSSAAADCRDIVQMRRIFDKYKPEYVIHLSAFVGGLFLNMDSNIDFFEANTQMNLCITKLCHEFSVKRAIFCLSTCIFPMNAELPLNEEQINDGPPHYSNEGYATAKRNLEMLIRFYREKYNYSWICVTPTNLYGKNDNFSLLGGHVIPALIQKCYSAKTESKPFVVCGSGKPLRQFLYVADAAKIILKFLRCDENKLMNLHNYILCSDKEDGETTIEEVSKLIAKKFSFLGEIQFDKNYADGIYRKTASNLRLRSFLGPEFNFTSLEKGISETIKWFLENRESIRR